MSRERNPLTYELFGETQVDGNECRLRAAELLEEHRRFDGSSLSDTTLA